MSFISDWTQPPGEYSAKPSSTDIFFVGPHNRFERNGVMLNDRSQLECFYVDDITGFDRPDIQSSAQQNVQETGELPDPSMYGGQTFTLTGYIKAANYITLMAMGRALSDSLLDLGDHPLVITTAPHSIFTQPEVSVDCHVADWNISRNVQQSDLGGILKRAFTIALRASHPGFKAVTEKTASLIPTVTSIPGRPYDRVYDIEYSTLMDASGTATTGLNTVTITNEGNWFSYLRLRATGYLSSVVIVNATTGQVLYFTEIAAGAWVELDTRPLTQGVLDNTGAIRAGLMDSRSDWLWLNPKRGGSDGSNKIVLYVQSYDSSGRLDLWWTDTYL